ncbi:MAG: DUF1493 family protein, partial [Deltaproteobacteria bacterium]|nr:DUF1493 family protein [Deltaproteobacteria bacterium]
RGLVSGQSGVPETEITLETRLFEDLGMDGDDGAELLAAFGDEFGVDIRGLAPNNYFNDETTFTGYSLMIPVIAFLSPAFRAWVERASRGLRALSVRDLVASARARCWIAPQAARSDANLTRLSWSGRLVLAGSVALPLLLGLRQYAGAGVSAGRAVEIALWSLLLLWGLSRAPAASVALWLNLETVATGLLAWAWFKEHLGAHTLAATALVIGASVLLAAPFDPQIGLAALLVTLACVCWGLDNNFTALIDRLSPTQTTFAKGLVAGGINLGLGLLLAGDPIPPPAPFAGALALGGLSYGASLVPYISGAQQVGATRSQLIFATAPFWGVVLSWLWLDAAILGVQLAALGVMLVAVWLLNTALHAHVHSHGATLDSIGGKPQCIKFGDLFSPGNDHGNRAALHHFFELLAVIGLDYVGPQLRGDAASQAEVAGIASHILPDGGHGQNRNAVPFSFVHQFRQAHERLPFVFRPDKDGKCHGGDVQAEDILDGDSDVLVGKILQNAGPAGDPKNHGYRRVGIDRGAQNATGEHHRICIRQKRLDGLSRLF